MTIKNEVLLGDLIEKTRENLNQLEKFKQLSLKELNQKSKPESWSILECVAHLNIYGDFYLPEIEKQLHQTKHKSGEVFKSGFLGNYFVKLMEPKATSKKMKTMKKFDPLGSQLDKATLEVFKNQQLKLLDLLSKSSNINLSKTKTAISISKLIKLRLGDTLRFVVAHNERHLLQAERLLFLT